MTDLPIIFASFVINLSVGVSSLRADRAFALRVEPLRVSPASPLQSHDAGDLA